MKWLLCLLGLMVCEPEAVEIPCHIKEGLLGNPHAARIHFYCPAPCGCIFHCPPLSQEDTVTCKHGKRWFLDP